MSLRIKVIGDHIPGVEKVFDGFRISPKEEFFLSLVEQIVGIGHFVQILLPLIGKNKEQEPFVDTNKDETKTLPPNPKRRHFKRAVGVEIASDKNRPAVSNLPIFVLYTPFHH